MLDVGGINVGFLKKFSGLAMEADIVTHDHGPNNSQSKNVANIKWTPGKATVGIGMGKGMYTWIKEAFDKGVVTKNGALTSADFNYNAQSEVTFNGALITGVTVPKLDGSSKDAAYFDVEFEAEQVRWAPASGQLKAQLGMKQKQWLCCNFRFELGGLPCTRVASIDSFTWKCAVASDQVGLTREATKHAAKVTVPDLKVAISHADHDPWAKAAKSWFIDGNHLAGNEMQGSITFLDPTLKVELGRIDLINVGFKKFADDDLEANSEKIKRFNVELYVEQMKFTLNQTDA